MGTQLFDEVIGELPPSTVDVAGIVRREKRRGAARRVTGLTTAVVALAVTAAIGLGLTGGTGASSPPSANGGSPGTGTAAPDVRFALVARNEESAAASAKRLGAAFDAAFRKEAPGAGWIFEPERKGQTGADGRPPKLGYHVGEGKAAGQQLFHGGGGVLNGGRKGSLTLAVSVGGLIGDDGTVRSRPLRCSPKDLRKCTAGKAPSGARMIFLTTTFGDVRVVECVVELPDGRVLSIGHTNNFGVGGPPQQGMPLTNAQVTAIATDVASQIKA